MIKFKIISPKGYINCMIYSNDIKDFKDLLVKGCKIIELKGEKRENEKRRD